MEFFDRDRELALLEEFDGKRPSFIVITGRRRVGKTAILRRFIEGKRAVYLYVDEKKSRDVVLAEFTGLVREALGLPEYVRYDSLAGLLRYLIEEAGEVVVAIDEFQRLERIDPPLMTELQDLWDRRPDGSGTYLLASGSSMGMMRRIFTESGAPLFKRSDNIITIKPFTMAGAFEMMAGLGIRDTEQRLELFCLFGGMAYYYAMMERYGATTLGRALDRLLLSELAPLRTEVRDVMVEEFGKEHPTYFEILSALAQGKCTKKEIGDATHVEATSLSPYLSDLIDLLGLVEHVVPATDRKGRSKRGRYRIKDNFFRFYFAFIYPNASLYEVGAFDRLGTLIKDGWGTFRGRSFETAAVEALRHELALGFPVVGPYWDRWGNEVDLVAIDRARGRMLLAEIKSRRVPRRESSMMLEQLGKKAAIVPFKAKVMELGLVAPTVDGRAALEREGHRVWELGDLLALGGGAKVRSRRGV
jgi:AAA+ ATPase superfamily predicted ATPase